MTWIVVICMHTCTLLKYHLLLLHKECKNNDNGVTLEEDDNEKT